MEDSSEEKQWKYGLLPSLQQAALRTIAVTLWNQNIRNVTSRFLYPIFSKDDITSQWESTVSLVQDKVNNLFLPECFKREIRDLTYPIGLEFLKWKSYHETFFHEQTFLAWEASCKLYWTSLGTIDYKRSAELLLTDNEIDITFRYKLACLYCLRNYIPFLWIEIPEDRKKYFYCKENPALVPQWKLVVYWTYEMKGEVAKLKKHWNKSPYQLAFESAARLNNKVAVRYFCRKLTPREKEESLMKMTRFILRTHCFPYQFEIFPRETWYDVIFYLISQMTEEQQMYIIQKYTISVIAGFLVWPWQDLFIEMAAYFWSSIKLRFCDYSRLFYLLVDNEDSTGYNYKKLLAGFWCQSPHKYKNYLINVQCDAEGFLTELFRIEDEEHIRVILKNVTSTDREKLLLSETGLDICIRLVNKEKWCLLDTFLCECKLSNEAIVKFRRLFQNNLGTWYTRKQIKLRDHDWNKFYEWLDAFEVGDGKKRSIEYEEIFNAKKLCCEEPAKNNKGVKKNTKKIKKTRIPNLRSRSTVTTRSGTRGIPTTRLIVKKNSKNKKKNPKGQGE